MQITEVADAIRRGDVSDVEQFLQANPTAVSARVDGQRTWLHVATDWPGHFPKVRETIHALIARGAAPNATFHGHHGETPLHWAASSDDLPALDALLDLGADIESPGSVIDGGAPLSDAVAFRQWRTARRLIARGARATLWHSAALGLMDRLRSHFSPASNPPIEAVTNAFWNACNGGQWEAAQFLLARGADLNWVGHDGMTPLNVAARSGNAVLVEWLRNQGSTSSS